MERPTPFDLVFSGLAPERFPPLRDALAAAEVEPRDRDAFLLTHPAMTLLRELRPDDADAGTGIEQLTALVHHAFLHWAGGCRTRVVEADELRPLLEGGAVAVPAPTPAEYIRFPEHLVWASLASPGPWEPLDGAFVYAADDGELHALGIFGLHPARDGFTVAEANGRPGRFGARRDGTPLFAPALEGGALAGLHALVEPEELVELVARALACPSSGVTIGEGG